MSDDQRLSERQRREAAQAAMAAGSGVEPGARVVPPREMKQMVSARFEAELVRALRDLARRRGVTTSDLLREAVIVLLDRDADQPVHLEVRSTSGATVLPLRFDVPGGASTGVRTSATG